MSAIRQNDQRRKGIRLQGDTIVNVPEWMDTVFDLTYEAATIKPLSGAFLGGKGSC